MRKLLTFLIALGAIVFAVVSPALAQATKSESTCSPSGARPLVYPAPCPPSVAAYQGPGDVVSGALVFASPARAYDAALATTSTSLADLVAITGGAAVCTLRASSSGYVDLASSYCAGTTPALACASASGGACKITKIYDQTGNSNHLTNSTLANMPQIAFNTLNGLPAVKCSNSDPDILNGPTFTQAQPLTISNVYERTANFTNGTLIWGANALTAGPFSGANQAAIVFGSNLTATAADSVFHALQGVANGASSALVIDGTATTGNPGTNGFSSTTIRFCRNSASFDGFVMEVGVWPSAFNSTQYANMNTNQHSATVGYNF